jgi:hypothetical protein
MDNDIINFLNGRTKQELKDLNVTNRTIIFMDAKRVLTKKRLLENYENKSHQLVGEIGSFKKFFNDVINHRLPYFWDGNGDLYT